MTIGSDGLHLALEKARSVRYPSEQSQSPHTLIYATTGRYGTKGFTNKKAAVKHAKDEVKDGWPAVVRDLRTGDIVWEAK